MEHRLGPLLANVLDAVPDIDGYQQRLASAQLDPLTANTHDQPPPNDVKKLLRVRVVVLGDVISRIQAEHTEKP